MNQNNSPNNKGSRSEHITFYSRVYFIIAKSKIPFIIYKPLFAKHCTYVTGSLQRRHRDALSHILRFIWYQHPLPHRTPGNRPYFCSLSLTCHMISSISYDMGFRGGSEGKASAYDAGDPGSIPGQGRSPGEENGNPLQYSCLKNPMDRGACGLQSTGWQRVRHEPLHRWLPPQESPLPPVYLQSNTTDPLCSCFLRSCSNL